MMWNNGRDAWSGLWMGGAGLLFVGAVILLTIWAIRGFSGPKQSGESAIDTLRKRLAAGEISPEDFEKTKKALGA